MDLTTAMPLGPALAEARAAYASRDWLTARAAFDRAAKLTVSDPDALYARANCDWWLGDLDAALPALERAHRGFIAEGRVADAALVALDTGYTHLLRGEQARGSGWLQRAAHLLDGVPECAAHGYVLHIAFEQSFSALDLDQAYATAAQVSEFGHRFDDPTLAALGVTGRGRVLVRRGRVQEGVALLDEAMVAATSEQLDPGWAGNIYCHLMLACWEVADLRRAGEWTSATAQWCSSMPGAGPFLGICRVHRAQILQVQGAWDAADAEAAQVCSDLAHFAVEVVAEAHYVRGEVRRLKGDLVGAEESYRRAHALGRDPQPGHALLLLARGRERAASSSIRSALAALEGDRLGRARLLPAAVDIGLVGGDLPAARLAVQELEDLTATFGTTGFQAESCTARGRVLLECDEPAASISVFRAALAAWQRLPAPFHVARVRLLLAEAYRRLGDLEGARLEEEAAAVALRRLGVSAPTGTARALRPDGLTSREAQILDLVATGRSNQEIAEALVLSVRTVERHLATVYQKLGLQGRTARAAAVHHALTGPRRQ